MLLAASLTVIVLVALLAARSGLAPARVYQDAADDYRREVLGHEQVPWVLGETKLSGLAELEGVPVDTARALVGVGYHMEKGRVCRLDGRAFLHLVYTDGTHEYSVFLRRFETEPLPGASQGAVNGKTLYEAKIGGQELASFRSGAFTVLVVAPDQTALALARSAAVVL